MYERRRKLQLTIIGCTFWKVKVTIHGPRNSHSRVNLTLTINSLLTGLISNIQPVCIIFTVAGIVNSTVGHQISALPKVFPTKTQILKLPSKQAKKKLQSVSNPYTVSSNFTERTILSVPSNPWEQTPYGKPNTLYSPRLSSNEGPEQLINPTTGQNFVIYSAARSDNRNYCLGLLELVGDDPMNVGDWRKNNEGCVFYQNALVQVRFSLIPFSQYP